MGAVLPREEVKEEVKEIKVDEEVDYVNIPDIGKVEVTVMNRKGSGGDAFVIHGAAEAIKQEWIHVGSELCQVHDLTVYVPNLHSNEKTKDLAKKGLTEEELRKRFSSAVDALTYILEKHYKLNNVLLCGKSIGSRLAVKMGSTGDWFSATILTNPTNEQYLKEFHKKNKPLLFVTNSNDKKSLEKLHLYANEWMDDKNFEYFVGPAESPAYIKLDKKGGHTMSLSFTKPILEFTKKHYLK